jgi:hypothetical protein
MGLLAVKIEPAARILAAYKKKHVFEKYISFLG